MNQKNKSLLVKEIEDKMRRGWPDGTLELYREIPVLLDRIKELENALLPFARAGAVNWTLAKDEELVNVYMKDCVEALRVVDRKNSEQVRHEDFGLPAE